MSDAGDAEDRGAVVVDQPARDADQDRRQGVSHGRYVTFQMAEVAVPRQMFAESCRSSPGYRRRPLRHDSGGVR
jgi:hypothetical protein